MSTIKPAGQEPMSELEKLHKAAAAIHSMTDGRQTMHSCGYIVTRDDANYGLQMIIQPGRDAEHYQVTFCAYMRRGSANMGSSEVLPHIEELNVLHALLVMLELQDFHPSVSELHRFLAETKLVEQEVSNAMQVM